MKPWVIACLVLGAAIAVFAVVYAFVGNDDRFGDPGRLDAIESSTDCHELRQVANEGMSDMADGGEDFDQAVGYFNAANDRMEELGC